MRKILLSGAAVCAALSMAAPALAADVITNGGFTTDTVSWTITGDISPGNCSWTSTGGIPGATGNAAQASAGGPADCYLYQQVALAAGTTNLLTVDFGTATIPGDAAHLSTIEIRSSTGVLLQTLYTRDGSQGSEPMAPRGPYNLDAYAGQTIRVAFRTVHTGGPIAQQIDNVVLDSTPLATIPTLSEWAMIILATMIAGMGAVLVGRRRRLA